MTDPNIEIIYNKLLVLGKCDKIGADSIVILTLNLIPIVQKLITESSAGQYKKKLVLSVLKLIIDKSTIDTNSKKSLYILLETTIPVTIDSFINIAKGNVNLHKLTTRTTKCCTIF